MDADGGRLYEIRLTVRLVRLSFRTLAFIGVHLRSSAVKTNLTPSFRRDFHCTEEFHDA
jgi:hypothetical protein